MTVNSHTMLPPPLHLSHIRCKHSAYRRCHGKQKGTMNKRKNEDVSSWLLKECMIVSHMNKNCCKILNVFIWNLYKFNLSTNVKLCPRLHLPLLLQWNLFIHPLGISICLTSRQNQPRYLRIFSRILLPSFSNFIHTEINIVDVPQNFTTKSVQYSCIVKEIRLARDIRWDRHS